MGGSRGHAPHMEDIKTVHNPKALRYELYYALDVDDVRFEPRQDPTWPSLP